MTTAPIRVATRRSQLAVTQAQTVADALSALTSRPAELVLVTTEGDTSPGSLVGFGGVGVFVGAVREAIVDGRADVGVHSLKDLPTAPHPDLVVVATPVREDPRDAFCGIDGATLADLPVAATVGTGSPRRASQLRALRPDLNVIDIRGNVDTRLLLDWRDWTALRRSPNSSNPTRCCLLRGKDRSVSKLPETWPNEIRICTKPYAPSMISLRTLLLTQNEPCSMPWKQGARRRSVRWQR